MSARLEFPLVFGHGCARMRAAPLDGGGWVVSAVVDGKEIVGARCPDWQRVEWQRLRWQRELEPRATPAAGAPWRVAHAAVFMLAVLFLTTTAAAQSAEEASAAYQANLTRYVVLHDQMRQGVAREHIVDPRIREISGALLAARIRQARAEAAPNDVIPVMMADVIRDRLHRAFDPLEVDALLTSLYPRGFPAEPARLNTHYEPGTAVWVPVAVLSALPPVPGVLGYRLIGCDVVLWDEEAEIVIDVISDALPAPRIWDFLEVSSHQLRQLVGWALTAAHLDGRELQDDMEQDTEPGALAPVVGEPFDWGLGAMMPPSILHALPPLPTPLEYRFVGADLVVIDIASGRVTGMLCNALTSSKFKKFKEFKS